ncbi:MAG: NADPH-dependent FMN reductase [Parcubacteria bacterium C7867-005]|nr:MAG: NADPH-dependent FMN reductase [Parcubacteria bacterium C7867-005]
MFGLFNTKKKKIFILLGHPDEDSLNSTLANEYERGATEAGHEVRRMNIGDMQFDPILHHGYRLRQELEPDLLSFQENVRWSDHFVIFYPSWWSTMPALLKGLFDRVWLPGFAYNFVSGGYMWKRLLKGKSAAMVITSDTAPIIQRIIFGDTTNELKKGILWFSGLSPIYVHKFGYLKHFGMSRRENLKRKVFNLGKKAK